jgi:hypothetical protein
MGPSEPFIPLGNWLCMAERARSLGQHSFSPISSSVARQAAFNYAMLLCRRCIYVVHGSFLYIIYSAHILAARPYVLRAHLYVYIYIRQHQSLYSWGDGIKKWKWNACEFAVDIFPGYCAVQLVDGVSPWKAHASNKKEQSELQKAAQHHGSLSTCFI